MNNLTIMNPIFHNEEKAYEHFEMLRWGSNPACPHCGGMDKIYKRSGKTARPGLYKCGDCRREFTAKIGTIFESSHVPLHKWLLATHLMCSSKKGISSHQLHRTLNVTYKTAWFMSHRIREAMKHPANINKLGGSGKIVEVDETFWSKIPGVPKNKSGYAHKEKIFSLVERDGQVRSFHVHQVTGKTLKPIMYKQINKDTDIMTDDMGAYKDLQEHFNSHEVVRHSKKEYVRGIVHTNTVEGFFSILKRGLTGIYQHVMSFHLQRYVSEFDFRYTYRKISDIERFNVLLSRVEGRRLTYYQTCAI